MEKLAVFESAASLIEDFTHPALVKIKFILADDRPNRNGQGIEHEDFADLARSAINMPIKMRYLGKNGAGNHQGSVTIGHITTVNEEEIDNINRLVADGVLYAEEYPEEITYLKDSFASETAPGISWELSYSQAKIKNGINWLKGIVTKAATFVRNPAYGTRTALLALASNQALTDDQLKTELASLANELKPNITVQGGNNVEKELEELKIKLAAVEKELATKVTDLEKASSDLKEATAAVSSRDDIIAGYKKAALGDQRIAKIKEAGLPLETDPEKLAKKQEFLVDLKEEAFAEYLADLVAISKKVPVKASASATSMPKPDLGDGSEAAASFSQLKDRMRELSKPTVTS